MSLLLGAILAVAVALFITESDSNGPVGWALTDETTRLNPLREPPTLVITSGGETRRIRLSERPDGTMLRVSQLRWSLDEPVRITLDPVYDADEHHTAVIDLREGGANALAAGWYLRVDVIVRDRTVDLVVNQPRLDGIIIERVDVYRVSLRRQNEARLRSAADAARAHEQAEESAQQEASAARAACVSTESQRLRGNVGVILEMAESSYQAWDERIGDGTFTFPEYRAAVDAYIGELIDQQREAEAALSKLDPSIRNIEELERVIQAQISSREEWQRLLVALRIERDDPSATTFQDLYPAEFDAVFSADSRLALTISPARVAVALAVTAEANASCDALDSF